MPAKRPEKIILGKKRENETQDEFLLRIIKTEEANKTIDAYETFLREAVPTDMELELFISQFLNNPTGEFEGKTLFGRKFRGTFVVPPEVKKIVAAISQLYKERLG